jgi:hypothetical protein
MKGAAPRVVTIMTILLRRHSLATDPSPQPSSQTEREPVVSNWEDSTLLRNKNTCHDHCQFAGSPTFHPPRVVEAGGLVQNGDWHRWRLLFSSGGMLENVVPLMLTEKGKRANVQNELVDEEHDAAALLSPEGDAVDRGFETSVQHFGPGGENLSLILTSFTFIQVRERMKTQFALALANGTRVPWGARTQNENMR